MDLEQTGLSGILMMHIICKVVYPILAAGPTHAQLLLLEEVPKGSMGSS